MKLDNEMDEEFLENFKEHDEMCKHLERDYHGLELPKFRVYDEDNEFSYVDWGMEPEQVQGLLNDDPFYYYARGNKAVLEVWDKEDFKKFGIKDKETMRQSVPTLNIHPKLKSFIKITSPAWINFLHAQDNVQKDTLFRQLIDKLAPYDPLVDEETLSLKNRYEESLKDFPDFDKDVFIEQFLNTYYASVAMVVPFSHEVWFGFDNGSYVRFNCFKKFDRSLENVSFNVLFSFYHADCDVPFFSHPISFRDNMVKVSTAFDNGMDVNGENILELFETIISTGLTNDEWLDSFVHNQVFVSRDSYSWSEDVWRKFYDYVEKMSGTIRVLSFSRRLMD